MYILKDFGLFSSREELARTRCSFLRKNGLRRVVLITQRQLVGRLQLREGCARISRKQRKGRLITEKEEKEGRN